MVDVTDKQITARLAIAAGEVRTTAQVLDLIRADGLPKGDALAVARLAGIMAAKKTPDLVPLCHPIAIHGVTVELVPGVDSVAIEATVRSADRTGVEMEALTCVLVAGLTLIDMIKAVDPAATVTDVRVLRKEGGKTGLWVREDSGSESVDAAVANPAKIETLRSGLGRGIVVVASTRAARGVYEDRGGPILAEGLLTIGFDSVDVVVVEDGEPVREALLAAVGAGVTAVISTGGTGINPSDRTPEMTRAVLDYEIPGIADAVRRSGAAKTPLAALSRGVAGVAGRTLVVNLPGSTGGVRDGLAVLREVLPHAVDQLRGGDHAQLGSAVTGSGEESRA